MDAKLTKRLENYEKVLKQAEQQLQDGKISFSEFQSFMARNNAIQKSMLEAANVLAEDMHHANLIAAKIANGAMPDIYAVNANYSWFEILDQATKAGIPSSTVWKAVEQKLDYAGIYNPGFASGFTLYNHDTSELLLNAEWSVSAEPGKNGFLPKPSAKKKKELKQLAKTNPDLLWNENHFRSAMLQGVLQGESMTALSRRLKGVCDMNERQAIRNARTMTTNVQNQGRQRAYLNAKDKGVNLVIEWYATLDGRTRHSHRMMHGKTKSNTQNGKFPNGCRWPGDPSGPAAEVYNCRCTTVSWVKGFEHDAPHDSAWLKQQGLDFDDWQKGMNKAAAAAAANPTPAANIPTPNPAAAAATAGRNRPAPPPADPYDAAIRNARDYSYAEHEKDNFSQAFWDSLSPAERDAVYAYTGSDYETMNGLLRGTVGWGDVNNPNRWKYLINDCTDALSHRGLANDTKLYRGMGSERTLRRALGMENLSMKEFEQVVNSGNIKGLSFIEKGFVSTGVDAGSGWDKEVVLDIVAPKGTKGFYVSPVSRFKSERECLLQRGSIFRIYDTERMPNGNLKLKVVVTGTEPLAPV